MILEEFEKVLASKWEEYIIHEEPEDERKPRTHPVPVAFMVLEKISDDVIDGEVVINNENDKYWQVLEREYSISRHAAEVLMILARKYPSVVKINHNNRDNSAGRKVFEDGLIELATAGVLDKRNNNGHIEYELSHDLLASVVFEENFSELWKETQSLRSIAKMWRSFPLNIDEDLCDPS